MFDAIKADLPNLPDEVISMWLLPMAMAGKGWPPDPHGLGSWRYILGLKSLDYWRKTQWDQTTHSLEFNTLCPETRISLDHLFRAHALGEKNEYSNLKDGKERFNSVFQYVRSHGVIPRPAIIRHKENGLSLLDGNHRVSALTAARVFWRNEASRHAIACSPQELQPVWVVTGPVEGKYEPDPVTAYHDKIAREGAPIPIRKRTLRLPRIPK